ncbi:9173_t:CDS:1, partial [Racocetra fulgida]
GDKSSPADIPKTFRYGSFATIREKSFAKWYVNGKDYFYAVSEAISNAEKEIFIEDWWLSPELVSLIVDFLYNKKKSYNLDSFGVLQCD